MIDLYGNNFRPASPASLNFIFGETGNDRLTGHTSVGVSKSMMSRIQFKSSGVRARYGRLQPGLGLLT